MPRERFATIIPGPDQTSRRGRHRGAAPFETFLSNGDPDMSILTRKPYLVALLVMAGAAAVSLLVRVAV